MPPFIGLLWYQFLARWLARDFDAGELRYRHATFIVSLELNTR